MREIKFRGLYNGNFVYGNLVHGTIKGEEFFQIDNGDFDSHGVYEVEPESVCQFTGLTDKNGKEIYEGDIVKYYQPYAKRTDIHIVKWDYNWAGFGLFEKDNAWCKELDWVKIKNIEIIGNIHQTELSSDISDVKILDQ